jgi:hypothetical protein
LGKFPGFGRFCSIAYQKFQDLLLDIGRSVTGNFNEVLTRIGEGRFKETDKYFVDNFFSILNGPEMDGAGCLFGQPFPGSGRLKDAFGYS